jgi:hypothetical protein
MSVPENTPPAPVAIVPATQNPNKTILKQIEQSQLDNPEHAIEEAERTTAYSRSVPTFGGQETSPQAPEKLILNSEMLVADTVVVPPEPLILNNPLPETLVLTTQERVIDTVAVTEQIAQSPQAVNLRQNKLEALNQQPFKRESYLEFAYEQHSELRAQYDAVLAKARLNLKRFSTLYTPSKTEKEALQFLSSLQAQYARMQKAESEIGIVRAELMNSLNRNDKQMSEVHIKEYTQSFLTEIDKLFTNINKLAELIEVAKSEEKPPLAEAYRSQLEIMRVDGNKILTTLPQNHPRYEEVVRMQTVDLPELITFASAEAGGDKNVLEQSSMFITRRDHIKQALVYIKKEQEYTDFATRMKSKVAKLELEIPEFTKLSPEDKANIGSVLVDVAEMENILTMVSQLPELVPLSQMAQSTLKDEEARLTHHKTELLGYYGNAEVILEQLRKNYASEVVVKAPLILTDAELVSNLENSPGAIALLDNIRRYNENSALIMAQLTESTDLGSAGFRERVKTLVAMIPLGKISKVAALGAFLAVTPESPANPPSNLFLNSLGSLALTPAVLSAKDYNASTIYDHLRQVSQIKVEAQSEDTPPVIMAEAPPLSEPVRSEVEIVPGVILPESSSTNFSQSSPQPLEIFSDNADEVPLDGGIKFASPIQAESEKSLDTKYEIKWGDTFWDINEGQSLAGKLPVMEQINPYFRSALIDLARDEINKNQGLRTDIGGFGDTANDIVEGKEMNLVKLNRTLRGIAVEAGYLK